MSATAESTVDTVDLIRRKACPLSGGNNDYDPLLEMMGDASFVLLGEATHGTHEFYRERAQITKRLIQEKGFTAVAVEADWPDAYRVNRFVRGEGEDGDAEEALSGFKRFPTWMWRNADVLNFVGWLRNHNDRVDSADKVGFYGLDLYSLNSSIEAVLRYLKEVDPDEARRARARYSCFENFGKDPHNYAAIAVSNSNSCEEEVIRQLVELRRRASQYTGHDGDEYFFAEQNARLVKNAEQYYRSMLHGRVSSWNLRDRHMVETLDALITHLGKARPNQKIIIWEHNSHVGDARATEMGERGEFTVGQLVREKYKSVSRLIGFTTFNGSVTAASEWDQPPERKEVLNAIPDSYELLFHEVGMDRFFLNLREPEEIKLAMREPRLQRAIGVIYLPATERQSHYFESRLSDQFDAILHFDNTRAVEPLERFTQWKTGEIPETFPFSV